MGTHDSVYVRVQNSAWPAPFYLSISISFPSCFFGRDLCQIKKNAKRCYYCSPALMKNTVTFPTHIYIYIHTYRFIHTFVLAYCSFYMFWSSVPIWIKVRGGVWGVGRGLGGGWWGTNKTVTDLKWMAQNSNNNDCNNDNRSIRVHI